MPRATLSRAILAALAVAALTSGGTLVTSSAANASGKIDPGFSRGPVRIDPGFSRNSGLNYTVTRTSDFRLHSNCHWIDKPIWHSPYAPQTSKVQVCY